MPESPVSGSASVGRERIRVLHLTSSAGFYGAERVIVSLMEGADWESFDLRLATLQKRKLSSSGIIDVVRGKGRDAQLIACRGRLDRGALKTLVRIIRDERIQILHCHEPKSRLYGAIASRMTGARLVATNHNWSLNNMSTRAAELVDAVSLLFCDKIIAVSNPVAALMRRVGIPARRIEVIPNGIDIEAFRALAPDLSLRRSLGIPDGLPIVGTVGRFDSNKRHDRLIEAARRVADAGQDAAYLLVGDGPDRASIEALTRRLGMSDRVFLAGYQSDVTPFYGLMDVFAMTSTREGTPMALLEAMAAGKPFVATAVGGIPDVVSAELRECLVPEDDLERLAAALLAYLGDPQRAAEAALAGRRRVEVEYSQRTMAERYEGVYRRCLQGAAPSKPSYLVDCMPTDN